MSLSSFSSFYRLCSSSLCAFGFLELMCRRHHRRPAKRHTRTHSDHVNGRTPLLGHSLWSVPAGRGFAGLSFLRLLQCLPQRTVGWRNCWGNLSVPISWEGACWEKHIQMGGELQLSPVTEEDWVTVPGQEGLQESSFEKGAAIFWTINPGYKWFLSWNLSSTETTTWTNCFDASSTRPPSFSAVPQTGMTYCSGVYHRYPVSQINATGFIVPLSPSQRGHVLSQLKLEKYRYYMVTL